jgi:hypothetical protein
LAGTRTPFTRPCAIEPAPGRTRAFSTPSSPPFASWKEPPRVRGGPTPRSEKRDFPHPHWRLARLPRPAGENKLRARCHSPRQDTAQARGMPKTRARERASQEHELLRKPFDLALMAERLKALSHSKSRRKAPHDSSYSSSSSEVALVSSARGMRAARRAFSASGSCVFFNEARTAARASLAWRISRSRS